MSASTSNRTIGRTRRDLMLLMLASLAFVVALMLLLTGPVRVTAIGAEIRQIGVVMLVSAVAMFGLGVTWRVTLTARQKARRAEAEAAMLRRDLTRSESIVRAEPQIVILWEQGRGVRVMRHTLSSVPGLPREAEALLTFRGWLKPHSADVLRQALDRLFAEGQGFHLLIETAEGGQLEADGRAAGGAAVLRLRDVQGLKRDLVHALEIQRRQAGDIELNRALLDELPMPVWRRSEDGRLAWVNRAYAKAVEMASIGDVIDRQIELIDSRQRSSMARQIASAKSYQRQLTLVVDGERKRYDVRAIGHERAAIAAAIDITAAEKARREIERLSAAHDRTLDRVATAVATFGRDGALGFHNQAYRDLWKLDETWLAGRPSHGDILDHLRQLSRLPAVGDWRRWKSRVLTGADGGGPYEDWWHLPDGRILHVRAEPRQEGGTTFLFDDETEKLALESNYKTLIDVQRETLDSLSEAVAVLGPDGRLKLFNSRFAAIWRLSPDFLAEAPHVSAIVERTSVLFDTPEAWNRLANSATSIDDERRGVGGEMVLSDGTVIAYAAMPLPDGATLLKFEDVTATRRYAKTLLERNQALEAADTLKSRFVEHVSYQLRTPLTNIIGFSDLLSRPNTGTLNLKQREYLDDILLSSRTLSAIIDDILDLATIDAGALELKREPIEAGELIDAAIATVAERAARAGLEIESRLQPSVGSFLADPARLRQILYNLLTNAISFSSRGGHIRVSAWRAGNEVLLSVEDEGQGISPEDQAHVFDRFETRGAAGHRGAGLGLPLVKSLVELHGGRIELNSAPGRGTRATIALPQKEAA